MNKKITLNESDMPKKWYNVAADMPNKPLPPLHPGTKQPVGPEDLAPLFPMELIKQEVSGEKFIEIPDGVREKYLLYRPSPLVRATALEKALDTPARIYYKYEGGSPSGSHKTNTAFAQAFYNREEGVKKIVTETGAGQWGTALSFACQQFGLACDVSPPSKIPAAAVGTSGRHAGATAARSRSLHCRHGARHGGTSATTRAAGVRTFSRSIGSTKLADDACEQGHPRHRHTCTTARAQPVPHHPH